MNEQTRIAWRLAHGLAGYFQFVSASRLLAMLGKDTAQFVMCQVLQSNQAYKVKVSAKPPNWKSQKRIDAGLFPKGVGAKTWYGVVEVKWMTSPVKADSARFTIIEDCARVASVKTANLNAKFLVVGFTNGMLENVFDDQHKAGTPPESRRKILRRLLRPDLLGKGRSLSDKRITSVFHSASTFAAFVLNSSRSLAMLAVRSVTMRSVSETRPGERERRPAGRRRASQGESPHVRWSLAFHNLGRKPCTLMM